MEEGKKDEKNLEGKSRRGQNRLMEKGNKRRKNKRKDKKEETVRTHDSYTEVGGGGEGVAHGFKNV